jgi:type I restriction enzyme, S subunit
MSWGTKKLVEVSKINYGYTDSASFSNVGPKFLRITDIQDNNVEWNTVPFCKCSEENLPKYQLTDGDIVFARTGATTGKSYLIKNPPNAVFASYLIRVKINSQNELLPEFLSLFFQTKNYWDNINEGVSGSAQGGFNATKLGDLEIPLPSLPEQRHIVSILVEAFAAIAKAKANTEKNLQNAKELFESYLKGVFANPDWKQKTLNEIAENLDSKRVPITKNVRKAGEYPYYGASGIVDYVADYIFDGDFLLVSEDGANLLDRTYPIAFSSTGKTWVNNHAHVLRFNSLISQRFVEYYLNSIKLDDYVSGMAQPKLNQKMLNTIPIPFPSNQEQKSIVDKLDLLSTETKKLKTIYQQKLNDLEELKKSILQKACSGNLKTLEKELA